MKGVLKRRIWRMVGIVLGSVLGFVGVVVGVMAAMGKFKTPVVYPTVLEFAVTEQIVVENIPYDGSGTTQTATLYSFMLNGTNPDEEHEVNQTKCYVWFADVESSNLIVLCDENRNLLAKDKNNRFLVDCNKPIYYMINEVNYETSGKVTLYARSTNETLKKPDQPMTIWIDRAVKGVFIDQGKDTPVSSNDNKQEITVGVDIPLEFDYVIDTPLSVNPIDKVGYTGKDIELYYDVAGMGYGDDFLAVTEETVEQEPLNSIFSYNAETDKFTFKSLLSVPDVHTFYIAVFKTYKAREDYYNSIDGKYIPNPNFHKVESLDANGVKNMAVTELKIRIADFEISNVEFVGDNIDLLLYQENKLYLNSESQENNLGIVMKKGESGSLTQDNSRINEILMGWVTSDMLIGESPSFVDKSGNNYDPAATYDIVNKNVSVYVYYTKDLSDPSAVIANTPTKFVKEFEVVDCIEVGGTKYYSQDGAAINPLGNTQIGNMKVLKKGSYLNFYIKDKSNLSCAPAEFDYSSIASGNGTGRYFEIVPESTPEIDLDTHTLEMGILVVNKTGENLFASKTISLGQMQFEYDYKNYNGNGISFNKDEKKMQFNISFDSEGNPKYSPLSYNDILEYIRGSYSEFVFVSPKKDNAGNDINHNFKTLPNVVYTDDEGNDYVVVGYNDGTTNHYEFMPSSKFNEGESYKVFLLQLKNDYKETADDIITKGKLNDKAIDVFEPGFSIESKFVMNTDLVSYKYFNIYIDANNADNQEIEKVNGCYNFYEKNSNRKLIITMPDAMLKTLKDYSNITEDNVIVQTQYRDRVEINDIDSDSEEGIIIITFETKACLSDENIPISIDFVFAGVTLSLGEIKILSGDPDAIVFNYDGGQLTLSEDSKNIANTIYAKITYKDNTVTYKYSINNKNYDIDKATFDDYLNENISSPEDNGFQSDKDKGQTTNVELAIDDESVAQIGSMGYEIKAYKEGNTFLKVKIGDTIGFINLYVEVDTLFTYSKKTTTVLNSEDNLVSLFEIKYNNSTIDLNEENLVFINYDSIEWEYGGGELEVEYYKNNGFDSIRLKNIENGQTVLSIINSQNGYQFKYDTPYISFSFKLDVRTIFGVKSFECSFASSVKISVNKTWQDRIVYAGTYVEIYDSSTTNQYGIFNITNNSGKSICFKIRYGDGLSGLADLNNPTSQEISSDWIGKVKIEIYLENGATDILCDSLDFAVKPNVIAVLKKTALTSEESYSISDIYDLYKFDSITYGEDESHLYSKYLTKTYYTDGSYQTTSTTETKFFKYNDLSPLSSYDGLTIDTIDIPNSNPQMEWSSLDDKFEVGEMNEINEQVVRNIALKYNNEKFKEDDEIIVENEHKLNFTNLEFMAMTECGTFVAGIGTDFVLSEIKVVEEELKDEIKFNVDNMEHTFTIDSITKEYENVAISVLFTNNARTRTLEYNTIVKIVPYKPMPKSSFDIALSGQVYDLFNGIYDFESINKDLVQKLWINGVKETENYDADYTSTDIINNWNGGGGYIQGVSPSFEVEFNEIAGQKRTVYIEFEVTYIDGKSYVYYVPFTIQNRQEIEAYYPESDFVLSSGDFTLTNSKFANDMLNLGGTEINSLVYNLNNLNYEPILIYSDKETTFNFKQDYKKSNRLYIYDNVLAKDLQNFELNIELIAYQNKAQIANYIENISFKKNEIVLPKAQAGMLNTLIFKLSTESGNFVYYTLYVYCAESDLKLNHENNLEVVAYDNQSNTMFDIEDYAHYQIDTSSSTTDIPTTYGELIKKLDTSDANTTIFSEKFKVTYNVNVMKIYLYHGEATGGEFDYYKIYTKTSDEGWNADCLNLYVKDNNKYVKNTDEEFDSSKTYYYYTRYTDVTNENITLNEYFNTITLGLVMDNVTKDYCFGTITLYVQPTKPVIEKTEISLDYELPNGYFQEEIVASTENYDQPFTWASGITAEIQDGDLLAQGYKIVNGCIVKSTYEGTNPGDDDKIVYLDGSTIKLRKRVENDLIFTVKYTYNKTVVYVTYTYKATVIPSQTSEITVIGEFGGEESGFNVEKNINTEQFFGTYNPSNGYTIAINGTNYESAPLSGVTFDKDNHKLTFTQTHAEQIINVTIIYTNFDSTDNTRTFRFRVSPGIYFATETGANSGLTSASRLETYINTNAYSSDKASYIEFDQETIIVGRLYKFTIVGSGLTIYTNSESKLALTFDEGSYVFNSNEILGGGQLAVSGDNIVNFIHSAEPKPINMKIKVQTTDATPAEYGERDFYLLVKQTYTTLTAQYLVDGADHENVTNNKLVEDMHSMLLDGARVKLLVEATTEPNGSKVYYKLNSETGKYEKYVLATGVSVEGYLEIPSSYYLLQMGFNAYGNPNFITFTSNSNATIKTIYESDNKTFKQYNIQFNTVTKNTDCAVYLNNNSGITTNSVVYNYQIMVSETAVDGLDYSTTTGYDGTKETNKYISFLLEDEGNSSYNKKFVVGTMLDLKNESVFTVSGTGYNGPYVIEEGKTTYITDDGKVNAIGGYTNGIQYSTNIKVGIYSYDVYITLDLNTKQVELFLTRDTTTTVSSKTTLSLTLGGVNGSGSIVSGLNIVLSNDIVYSNYETSSDTSLIYAGYSIDLLKENKFVSNNDRLEYELAKSAYTLNGKEYLIYAGDNDNNLFEYKPDKKIIETKSVGSDVEADIKFIVKSNNYIIKTISYKFTILLNYRFIVNGQTLEDSEQTNSLTTNFVLTNLDEESVNFPLTKEFISNNVDENENQIVSKGNYYYNVLAFDLYWIRDPDNKSSQDGKLIGKNSVDVELWSNHSNNEFEIFEDKIVFNKDFTGEIEIKLSRETMGNGTYSVIWTIYVTGILDLHYDNSSIPTTRLQDNSFAFDSGTNVNIFNYEKQDDVGVVMLQNADTLFSSKVDYYNNKSITLESGDNIFGYYKKSETTYDLVTNKDETFSSGTYHLGRMVTYQYVINSSNIESENQYITNEELFKSGMNANGEEPNTDYDKYKEFYQGYGKGSTAIVGGSLELTLPNVPASFDGKSSFFVTYKIYVEYLGLTYSATPANNKVQVFYVTYLVKNNQSVREYTYYITGDTKGYSSMNVNVNSGVEIVNNEHYLNFFNYSESLTTDGTNYTLKYSGNKLVLNNKYYSDEIKNLFDSDEIVLKESGVNKFRYNFEERTLYDITNNKDLGEMKASTDDMRYTFGNIRSIFSSNFTNIRQFISFIQTYENKTDKVVLKDKVENKFTLVEICAEDGNKTGRYGINLNENGVILFNNEMIAELSLYDNDVKTISVLPYSGNNGGFRLYLEGGITSKTEQSGKVELQDMFRSSYISIPAYVETRDDSVVANKQYFQYSGTGYNLVENPNKDNINSYYEINPVTLETSIIGVGIPNDLSWVNYATNGPDTSDDRKFATVTIPNGEDGNVYYVKAVTYTGNITNKPYCTSSQTFYYLSDIAYVPDYTVGGESGFFAINYKPDGDGNVNLVINNGAFKVWTMVSGVLKPDIVSNFNTLNCQFKDNSTGLVSPTMSDGVIKIGSVDLDNFKKKNPTATQYPRIVATIEVDNEETLQFEMVFSLYKYVKTEAVTYSSSTTELSVDLIQNNVYIPTSAGSQELTTTNLKLITGVVESDMAGFVEDYNYTTGKITLNIDNVKAYFEGNTSKTKLSVICDMSTDYGTFKIEIVINKST